jgi:hypothetical protein
MGMSNISSEVSACFDQRSWAIFLCETVKCGLWLSGCGGKKARPRGTLLICSPLLYSNFLCSTLFLFTLLFSTLLYPSLLYSTLLYSTLLYSALLYSTLNVRNNGARCEEWDTLPSQDHRANALWVIDLKPSTKDDVQQHLSGINFPMAQRMWDDFPRHETRRVYINTIPCTFSKVAKVPALPTSLDWWSLASSRLASRTSASIHLQLPGC